MKNRQDFLKRINKDGLIKEREYAGFLRHVVNNKPEYYERFLNLKFYEDNKILDFGCGPGKLLYLLSQKKIRLNLFGCDINKEIINFNKKEYKNKNINFSLVKEDFKTIFEDSFFDFVFLLDVVEHISEPNKFLKEINRIIKKGGKLIINTPDRFSLVFDPIFYGRLINFVGFNLKRLIGRTFMEYTHKKEYNYFELEKLLLTSKFTIVNSNRKSFFNKIPWSHRGSIFLIAKK